MPKLEEIIMKDMKENIFETLNDLICSLNFINLKKINIGLYNLVKLRKLFSFSTFNKNKRLRKLIILKIIKIIVIKKKDN